MPKPIEIPDVRPYIELVRSERFVKRLDPQPNGCVHWLGFIKPNGYGDVWCGGRSMSVHRAVWIGTHGVDPGQLTIDHICHDPVLCDNGPACLHRRCVNSDHLVAATLVEQRMRSNSTAAMAARGDVCQRGHPYADAYADGRCRQCKTDRAREQTRLVTEAAHSLGMTIEVYKAAHGSSARVAREIIAQN